LEENKKEVKRMSLFYWRKSESSSGAFAPRIVMARLRYIDWVQSGFAPSSLSASTLQWRPAIGQSAAIHVQSNAATICKAIATLVA
jgi:hypothetical protein